MKKEKKQTKKSVKSKTVKKSKTESPTRQKKHTFGKVFANWCGACKALKPKWLEMLHILQNQSPTVSQEELNKDEAKKVFVINKDGMILEIVQVPDTDYESFKTERPDLGDLEANGFPTIFRKIHDGEKSKVEYYNGDRDTKAMIDWAMGKTPIRQPLIMGGEKIQNHKKTYKKHKKSCGACKTGFSRSIAKFWGWK
jgi:thiol-disulfide isomerase/thioredoxin